MLQCLAGVTPLENYLHASFPPREKGGLILVWLGTKRRKGIWLTCCTHASALGKGVLASPEEQH